MTSRLKLAGLCTIPALAVGWAACGQSPTTQPESVASTSRAATPHHTAATATPVATTTARPDVSPDEECAGSQFKVEQFIGAWQEVDGSTVNELSEHGSLSSNTNGKKQFGTWQFKQVGQTPAAANMSAGSTCVLWFHWVSTSEDLFYVPLKVSTDHIQLSYVGRGNTIEWQRAAAQ